MRRSRITLVALTALTCFVAAGYGAAETTAGGKDSPPSGKGQSSCQLGTAGNKIKHVIYIQFDNTHFRRDNANVASDLEQMPHLLNFLKSNGTLFTNDHTILISHTAGGILSTLTGLYPDRTGRRSSNTYGFFQGNGIAEASRQLVQVLDRPRRRCEQHGRPDAEHDHRRAENDARAVGAVHPRRL